MDSTRSPFAEDKLIELVRKTPLLYDSSHKKYTSQEARRTAWREIGQSLNTTSYVCKKKWTKLRNTYVNVLRKRKRNPKMSKWRFEDKMFFVEIVGRRPTEHDESDYEANRTNEDSVDVSEMNFKMSLLAPPVQPEPPVSVVEPPPTVTIPFNNPSPINVDNRKRRQIGVMKECLRQNYANDETEMLFLSLSRSVKKLTPTEQVKVKSEIVNVVFQAEYSHAQSIKTNSCDSVPSSVSSEAQQDIAFH